MKGYKEIGDGEYVRETTNLEYEGRFEELHYDVDENDLDFQDWDDEEYEEEEMKKTGKPRCKLIGTDGNAFALLGKASEALRKCGQGDKVAEMRKEAMAGDYEHLLYTITKYVDVY